MKLIIKIEDIKQVEVTNINTIPNIGDTIKVRYTGFDALTKKSVVVTYKVKVVDREFTLNYTTFEYPKDYDKCIIKTNLIYDLRTIYKS